jgi:hypothetical protein
MDTDLKQTLLHLLQLRFEKNMKRHQGLKWDDILARIEHDEQKLRVLNEMESTGGEPDVVGFENDQYIYMDCSAETPEGRRNLCFDKKAWDDRKTFKPKGNTKDMAKEMGIELLNEEQYRYLQQLGEFDLKTSSWLETPKNIRDLGGALFADRRYNCVFVYHNGASSYYASRGFRGLLKV